MSYTMKMSSCDTFNAQANCRHVGKELKCDSASSVIQHISQLYQETCSLLPAVQLLQYSQDLKFLHPVKDYPNFRKFNSTKEKRGQVSVGTKQKYVFQFRNEEVLSRRSESNFLVKSVKLEVRSHSIGFWTGMKCLNAIRAFGNFSPF